jgi:hypothetical protein
MGLLTYLNWERLSLKETLSGTDSPRYWDW